MGKTVSVLIEGEVRSTSNDYYSCNNIAGVRGQLEWQGQYDDIQVTINSCGGDIAEGLGIYDYLRSLGVPICTIVVGQCCSAATIIFMAGDTRLISENVNAFMVHQTRGGITEATADEIRNYAAFVDGYNDRLRVVYGKTGQAEEVINELLSKDSFMNAQEALTLGFATAISKPATAKFYASRPAAAVTTPPAPAATTPPVVEPAATSTPESIQDKTMKFFRTTALRLASVVMAASKGVAPKAEMVKLASGDELEIETTGDSIAEGNPVKKGGATAADGDYTLENGAIVTVKDGLVEKVNTDGVSETAESTVENPTNSGATVPPTTPPTTESPTNSAEQELATLRAENARLTEQNTQLAATNSGYESRFKTVEANMGRLNKALELTSSQEVPTGGTNNAARPNPAQAKGSNTATSEEDERQAMLDDRKNRGRGTTAAA